MARVPSPPQWSAERSLPSDRIASDEDDAAEEMPYPAPVNEQHDCVVPSGAPEAGQEGSWECPVCGRKWLWEWADSHWYPKPEYLGDREG